MKVIKLTLESLTDLETNDRVGSVCAETLIYERRDSKQEDFTVLAFLTATLFLMPPDCK